eukprot:TRINITY_DN15528_c0_g2_i1.p1 TRINITY_DN15528_c0_g2~~TRINITY_DN15528_c0_g2_i1.p1  ORF type:complete len:704 (+),score=119.21 TRINITY_DN15528_c0_g2_i1:206-2113(+)
MAHEVKRSFEEDFARHLVKEAQLLQVLCGTLGCIGAGALSYLGLAALPVLALGPVKVALASVLGGAGGCQWACQWSHMEGERQGVAASWGPGASALAAIAGTSPPRPTSRRLKRVVKWAFRLLSRPGALSGEWRFAVFIEAACSFAPWAQRAHFLHATRKDGSTRAKAMEGGEAASQSLRHLLPLYRFLQRRIVVEVALDLCSAVAAAYGLRRERTASVVTELPEPGATRSRLGSELGATGGPGATALTSDRRCLALATVLATLGALDAVSEASRDRLRKGLSLEAGQERRGVMRGVLDRWQRWKRSKRPSISRQQTNQRLRRLGSAGRMVLRPTEVREILSSVPPMVLPGDADLAEDSDDEAAEFLSISDGSEDPEGPGSGYEQRCQGLVKGGESHSWDCCDPSIFKLRSVSYFVDAKKESSGPSMLELVDIDISRIGPHGPVFTSATHEDFSHEAFRRRGDQRFLFIWNWVIPPYQCVITAALNPLAPWLQDEASPQARTWKRFLDAEPEERRSKLKCIFCVETGPWVVRKLAIKKPTLVGKKLAMASHHVPDDYIEITMDVTNGGKGGGYEEMVTGMVLKHVKHMEMCICCLLEATEEDELPETALFAGNVRFVDFEKMICPMDSGRPPLHQ